jgi:hypothetical protein
MILSWPTFSVIINSELTELSLAFPLTRHFCGNTVQVAEPKDLLHQEHPSQYRA